MVDWGNLFKLPTHTKKFPQWDSYFWIIYFLEQDMQGELKSVIILTLMVFDEFLELIESA